MKKALIVFTRVPMAGRTKTRLMPYFTADECAEIHTAFLMDIAGMASNLDTDAFIAYDGRDAEPLETIFGDSARYFRQDAGALGPRMSAAMKRVFDLGALDETAYQAKDIGSGLIDVLCSTAYAARAMAHLDAKGYSYNSSVYSAGTRLIVNGRS